MKRIFLAMIAAFVLAAPAMADADVDSKVKAALAIAAASMEVERAKFSGSEYESAMQLAKQSGKPLIVWVNCSCPTCVVKLMDCVHVKLPNFEGSDRSRVIVGVPANNTMYCQGEASAMSAEAIRQKISDTKAAVPAHKLTYKEAYTKVKTEKVRIDLYCGEASLNGADLRNKWYSYVPSGYNSMKDGVYELYADGDQILIIEKVQAQQQFFNTSPQFNSAANCGPRG